MDHHPIVNVIMGVRSLHTLCASIDTMGQEKTMEFIADLILHHIKEIGEGRGFVVCMDGDWKGILSFFFSEKNKKMAPAIIFQKKKRP